LITKDEIRIGIIVKFHRMVCIKALVVKTQLSAMA